LSRAVSPALVSEYQTRLPDRKLLRAKLHEFYALAESQAEADSSATLPPQLAADAPPTGSAPKMARKRPRGSGL
jgi:hypothetical protein